MTVALLAATVLAATQLTVGAGGATAQSAAVPTTSASLPDSKPMTPERVDWLKKRCAQLVAYYDYYGAGRGENSDGPRNHTRIGASIECQRGNYRKGIDMEASLLVRKAFVVPKPNAPAMEPEDTEAPDITNPTVADNYPFR
ncbi:hypothetical protein [Reyranella soli]|uniref:Uncharacterized protein n=1 Tax=Reyranella soli TaxID=1230389 RepID=A0A512NEC1_9HYPH|nr:hypothetical protein [Reyranella soli]GEP57284.1 hypothetical protein RSO01_44500 [Reyranella soli]